MPPPEDLVKILTAALSVLLTGGLLTAILGWRKQQKQEPIDAETAAVANARTAGDMALALAKQQEGSINVLREDLKVVRADLDYTRTELTAVRTTLSGIVPWLRDLFDRWDEHRQQEDPPGGLPPGIIQ